MAIFRLEAKIFSREKRGRSVIAAAAYRAGTKLKDEIRDKIFDYARRTKGVINSTILAPEGAPAWATNSGQLWNTVEASEKRSDAQLAREFILALPKELSDDDQFLTAVEWAKKELVTSGMVIRAIQRRGEVQHYGMAAGWWDKTMSVMSRMRERASNAAKKTWQKLVGSQRDKGPERE